MRRGGASGAVVVSLLLVVPAQAGVITFSDTFGPTAVPFPAAVGATLSLFDPSNGTLTKVTLTLDADASGGSIAWDNEAPVSTDVTLGIGAEVTATGLAALTVVAVPLQTDSAVGVDADNDGAADFIGTDAFSVTGGVGSDSDSAMLVGDDVLPYIGVGTFDVTIGADVETFLSTTGGFGPIDPVPGNTEGTVTVTYEFTNAVPEPSAVTLFVLGAVGLGAYCLRRRKR
ncbi:MAG: choice-of-anchor E domain-containing protein [Pirellulales bacterium]